jgi:hypothetical protein
LRTFPRLALSILTSNRTAILLSGLFLPTIPLTYATLYTGIMVLLAACTVYQNREVIAKAFVTVLAAL